MKKLALLFVGFGLFACSSDQKTEEEKIEFKTSKERLSYVLGAMNARTIIGTQDANIARLDMEEIATGFNSNLSMNDPK